MTNPLIHALLVHFPIGIIFLGCFIEILSFTFKKDNSTRKFSFLIMIIATIFAIVALISGIIFTPELIGKAGELKALHMHLASGITTTMLAITILKGISLRKENSINLLK